MFRLKDSATALISTVAAQLLFFACVAVIARRYGPEELGSFNGDVALAMFLGTILACRYELACVSDAKVASLTALRHVLMLACISGVVIGLIQYHFSWHHGFVVFFAAAFFFQQTVSHYLNSLRNYLAIACLRILVNALLLASLLVGAHVASTSWANPFAQFAWITSLLSVGSAAFILIQNKSVRSASTLRVFLRDNFRFASYTFPSTLLASVALYGLSIVVPRWFDPISAGYFAAAYRLGAFPVSLIAQSIGGVLRRDAVAAVANNISLRSVLRPYVAMLSILSIAYVCAGLTLYTPFVSLFLGEQWASSAAYFNSLMPFFALQLIYIPLSQIFLATQSQRIDLLIQVISAVTLAGALAVCRLNEATLSETAIIFSISGAAVLLFGILITFRVANESGRSKFDINRSTSQAILP